MQTFLNILLFITFFSICTSVSAKDWETLFDHSQYQNAKISPNGEYIAAAVNHNDSNALIFLKRSNMASVGTAKLGGGYEVGNYYWVNNERVVIEMVKRVPWLEKPQSYGELFAINYDGSKAKLIYGYQMENTQTGSKLKRQKSIRGWANIIDKLPEDTNHILIESTPMSTTGERLSSILKLNIYTGIIKNELGKSPIPFSHFVTDSKGKLKAVSGVDENANKQVYLKKKNGWQKIPKGIVSNDVELISISRSGKFLYTLDNPNQNFKGLFKLNLEDLTYKNIFTDKNVDITDMELTADGRQAYALRIDDGYPTYLIIDKKNEEAQVFKSLLKTFPFSKVNITSRTDDGNYYVIAVYSDVNPGSLYLFDKEKNKLSLLFKFKPDIKSADLVQSEPIQMKASDGTLLNAYFTKAKSREKHAPVVVLVHGGPHGVRDYWGFSPTVQYLALNGYSVLQVNYRGSGGYGEKFEIDGHQAWGTAIQQDIFESYQWLVKQNKVENGEVCIMGASFGAYSAVQSAAIYPNTYKCAIANAGIYDLELMFEEGDVQARKSGMSYLRNVLGTDKKQLKDMSPVNYVEKIKAPLLLAHGEDDKRAPFEHVERLRNALDDANKPYEWFVLDKEEHGFYNPENQKAYMRKVISFLNRHLKQPTKT